MASEAAVEPHEGSMRKRSSLVEKHPNPFHNLAPWTPYEKFKAVLLGCTAMPVRLVAGILAFFAQAAFARLVYVGAPLENDRGCFRHSEGFGPLRGVLRMPVYLCLRAWLWALGFWYIKVLDKRSPQNRRKPANIIVAAPHTHMVDPFVLSVALPRIPCPVCKADVMETPFICNTAIALQGIFVDRRNPDSKHACKDIIAQRADPERWRGNPLLIFPEGTVTNGKQLIQFKTGPFAPGKPVMPVLIEYKNKNYDFTWVGKNSNIGMTFLRMMMQFQNHCTVTLLDQVEPTVDEAEDPILYANNVRKLMAAELGVPTTEHSYDDVWFSFEALAANVESDFLIQDLSKMFGLDIEGFKVLLNKFKTMDKSGSGYISQEDFARVAGFTDRAPESAQRLFDFFDTDGNGRISYRSFIQALALISGRCSVDSQARLAFLIYDAEGRGKVSVQNLRASLDNAVAATADNDAENLPSRKLLSDEAVNGATELSYEEFTALMRREPKVLEGALNGARQRIGLTFDQVVQEAADLKAAKEAAKLEKKAKSPQA